MRLRFTGHWANHKTYGQQLNANRWLLYLTAWMPLPSSHSSQSRQRMN